MTAGQAAGRPSAGPSQRLLAVARGDAPADLVLKGGRVLSVLPGELLDTLRFEPVPLPA